MGRFFLSSDGKPCVWPIPGDCLWTDGRYETDGVLSVSSEAEFAAEAHVFTSMLANLNTVKAEQAEHGAVRLVRCDDATLGAEGYRLDVGASGVAVEANTGHGVINGCMTLAQLIQNTYDSSICGVIIADSPLKAFRGVHVNFSKEMDMSWFSRFIDFLAKYRVSKLLLEIGDAVNAWDELDGAVGEICSLAIDRHIEPIPCMRYSPRSRNLDCLKGIARNFKTETMAFRFDGPDGDGSDNSAVKEFAGCICAIHARLGEMGVRMAVWSDRLHPATGGRKLRYNEETRRNDVLPSTWEAVDRIPKDILIIDENHGGMSEDNGSEAYFTSRGFNVVFGDCSGPLKNWERRIGNTMVAGAFVSATAGFCNEAMCAGENKISAIIKMSCLLWWAGYRADHTSRGYLLPHFLEEEIAQLYPSERDWLNREVRPSAKSRGYQALEMRKFYNSPLQHSYWRVDDHFMMFLKDAMGISNALPFSLFEGVLDFNSEYAFAIAGGGWNEGIFGIPVNCRARSLSFLHAYIIGKQQSISGENSLQGKAVGRYAVKYGDGTTSNADIVYGGTIYSWKNFRGTNKGAYCANPVLMGMSPEGLHYMIYAQEWVNGRPDAEIESLDLVPADGADGKIALFAVTAVK